MSRRTALWIPALFLACAAPSGGSTADSASTGPDSASSEAGGSSGGVTTGEAEPYTPVDGNAFPWATESTDAVCGDGEDNDGNKYIDCADFSCSRNPSVFVCGADSVYESTPDLCDNGRDDDGDQLADCDDPDCYKNPFHAVCAKPRVDTDCVGDGDGDGAIGCDDPDCRIDVVRCPPAAGSLRVLFDQTLDETAGAGPNSDWVIDSWGRLPAPSDPAHADDWAGALSGFGYRLHKDGHRLESLVAWDGRISFADDSNPQDLGIYDVLVLFEPSRKMRPEEKTAIVKFVLAGGGLLAVANHRSADRDGNGWSAPEVFNDMFDTNAVMPDPFGFRFDEVDEEIEKALDDVLDPTHPVIAGPAGTVAKIGFYTGCTARLTGTNPKAAGLITLGQPAQLVVGVAEAGKGRVVFVTDSAIAGDGTDSHGNHLSDHDAWNDPALDDRALFLNAITWLGG